MTDSINQEPSAKVYTIYTYYALDTFKQGIQSGDFTDSNGTFEVVMTDEINPKRFRERPVGFFPSEINNLPSSWKIQGILWCHVPRNKEYWLNVTKLITEGILNGN